MKKVVVFFSWICTRALLAESTFTLVQHSSSWLLLTMNYKKDILSNSYSSCSYDSNIILVIMWWPDRLFSNNVLILFGIIKFIGKWYKNQYWSNYYSSQVHEKNSINTDWFPMNFIIPNLFPNMFKLVGRTQKEAY